MKLKTVFRLLWEAKKYSAYLVATVAAILLGSALTLYTPQIMRTLISLIQNSDPELPRKALHLALIFLAASFGQLVMQFCRSYFSHVAAWNFVHDLRTKLYNHVQNLSMSFFHDKQTGQLMSRILSDSETMELFIAHAAADAIANTVLFIGVGVLLFCMNPMLALYALCVVPFVAIGVWYYAAKVRPLFRIRHQKAAEMSGILQDSLSGIKEIQAFNRQESEFDRFSFASSEVTRYVLAALKRSALVHPLIGFLNQLGTVVVIGAGGALAASNGIEAADIVAFVLYLSNLYAPINSLARLNEDLQNSLAAAERMFELLDIKSTVADTPDAQDITGVRGEIEFQNVSFCYNDGTYVLRDLSLKIKPSQTVALVGETGAGKSTIASLLVRFYDPSDGAILLDGRDLRTITLRSLHDNVSMVLQDVFLFHGTIEDNIRYGSPEASHEDVVLAAKMANADSFILETERGYNTIVGERGVRLSGGQKQRIAIARALLRNRSVLILDEATSAVDNTTEKLIHEAIDNVIKNRTTIIIAHRLTTIENADIIALIDGGRIIEQGTHEELMELGGKYFALYNTNQVHSV
ncbi:MAG: ABC transporter ATP-binding protein [Clostridia bacterium]|nr:ABC transporter ATP-binding protein [Clostridia bacterium]